MRNQFTFYRSFFEAVKDLPKKEQTTVLLAICDYALNGTAPELRSCAARAVFRLIRPTLDASAKKAESGKLGGLSKREANCKQTAREKEGKGEKEVEIEREVEIEGEVEKKNENYLSLEKKKKKKTAAEPEGMSKLVAEFMGEGDQA